MSDHTFCRLLLKETRRTLTSEQRKRLVGAWSYKYVGQHDGEFHVQKDDFYWHGSACCSYHARSQGISAWLAANYPEDES